MEQLLVWIWQTVIVLVTILSLLWCESSDVSWNYWGGKKNCDHLLRTRWIILKNITVGYNILFKYSPFEHLINRNPMKNDILLPAKVKHLCQSSSAAVEAIVIITVINRVVRTLEVFCYALACSGTGFSSNLQTIDAIWNERHHK